MTLKHLRTQFSLKKIATIPKSFDLIIEGKIAGGNKQKIHGLSVEILDNTSEMMKVLARTLTNVEGYFYFNFSKKDNLLSMKSPFLLRIRDRREKIIYTTKLPIKWNRGKWSLNIIIDQFSLRQHLSTSTTVKPLTGKLIPKERFQVINTTICHLVSNNRIEYYNYLETVALLMPDIGMFENLLDDAFKTLNGDISAREKVKEIFNLVGNRLTRTARHSTISSALLHDTQLRDTKDKQIMGQTQPNLELPLLEQWYNFLNNKLTKLPINQSYYDTLIPRDHLVSIILVASYLDELEPEGSDKYLTILNDQLKNMGKLNIVFNAARRLLEGSKDGENNFRSIIEYLRKDLDLENTPSQIPKPEPGLDRGLIPWPPQREFDPNRIPPSEIWRILCMIETKIMLLNERHKLIIPYYVTSITPSAACAGNSISIIGSGFGTTPYQVAFPSSSGQLLVNSKSWTYTRIEVEVPHGAGSGHLQLLIPSGTVKTCLGFQDLVTPGYGNTYFEGSAAEIKSFTANGNTQVLRVDPNDTVTFTWSVRPRTNNTTVDFDIKQQNQLGGVSSIASVPNAPHDHIFTFHVPPFNTTTELLCTLRCYNNCSSTGGVSSIIKIKVDKVPILKIERLEFVQGIQDSSNSLPTIENKDTIARAYISADLGGFNNDEFKGITGYLYLTQDNTRLYPINEQTPTSQAGGNPFIIARKSSKIERANPNHTLNFKIPANLCKGTKNIMLEIFWLDHNGNLAILSYSIYWSWEITSPFRVRYIRITDNRPNQTSTTPTDNQAMFTIQRAFELLPTPPTEIAALQSNPIQTTRDFTTDAGGVQLLNDIRALHAQVDAVNPSGINIRWIGLTVPKFRGWSDGSSSICSTYSIADGRGYERIRAAHELGHSLWLAHNNNLVSNVPFDPYWNDTITGTVYSFMSYMSPNWVTENEWKTLRVYVESVSK